MKHSFFQKQFMVYMFIMLIIVSPILLYIRSALFLNDGETFNIFGYLQNVIFSELFFITYGLLLKLHSKISVDQYSISLTRFGKKIELIYWVDLVKVYQKQDNAGTDIIFETKDAQRSITIQTLSGKNKNIIYNACPVQLIKDMIKGL